MSCKRKSWLSVRAFTISASSPGSSHPTKNLASPSWVTWTDGEAESSGMSACTISRVCGCSSGSGSRLISAPLNVRHKLIEDSAVAPPRIENARIQVRPTDGRCGFGPSEDLPMWEHVGREILEHQPPPKARVAQRLSLYVVLLER